MARYACRLGRLRLGVEAMSASDLTADIRQIIEEHHRLWLARNRPGGLDDSARRLEPLLKEYAAATG